MTAIMECDHTQIESILVKNKNAYSKLSNLRNLHRKITNTLSPFTSKLEICAK